MNIALQLLLQVQSAAAHKTADAKGLPNGKAEAKVQAPQLGKVQLRPKQSPKADANSSSAHVTELPRPQPPHAEPSEEELLQWQPVFPAKQLPPKDGTSAKRRLASRQLHSAAAADVTTAQPLVKAADSSPASSLAATSNSAVGSVSASVFGSKKAGNAHAAASSAIGTRRADSHLSHVTTPTADLLLCQSLPSTTSTAASAVSAEPAQLSMGSELLVSTGSHAFAAEPDMLSQHRTSPLPAQPAGRDFTPSAATPVAAADSPPASIDPDWLAMPAPELRQSMSSWSSEAADAQALRHSIASGSSGPYTNTSRLTDLQDPLTAGSYAVTSCDRTDLAPSLPVQWHLLNTEELQAQTAALLSSLATSTDWDAAATDAPMHRQMAEVGTHTQLSDMTDAHMHSIPDTSTLLESLDSELLPCVPVVPSLHATAAARAGNKEVPVGELEGLTASSSQSSYVRSSRSAWGRGLQRKAPAGHSPASSVALSETQSLNSTGSSEDAHFVLEDCVARARLLLKK